MYTSTISRVVSTEHVMHGGFLNQDLRPTNLNHGYAHHSCVFSEGLLAPELSKAL